jgi:effector-binding domain-containing protein
MSSPRRYDVDIVAVPEQAVLVLRAPGPLASIGQRLRRLRRLAEQAGLTAAGPMMARFYDADSTCADLDYDVCLPVQPRSDGSLPDTIGEARGELIPLHHALRTVHHGPHDRMDDAWRALEEAREALGYTASGPITEIYITTSPEAAANITEIRVPYAR